MRPTGYANLGFFPLSENGAKIAAAQLTVPDPSMVGVLDPCVGDGKALKIICDALKIPYENIDCVELAKSRGEEASALLPGANVLSPCCFLSGCNRPERAFSLVYCNPPYADELGGGYRVETQFLEKIGHMVPINAVLVMVVPYRTTQRSEFTNELGKCWRRVRIIRLEGADAPYDETLVIAYRSNNKPLWGSVYGVHYESKELTDAAWPSSWGDDDAKPDPKKNPEQPGEPFAVPTLRKLCDSFKKVSLTHDEIVERLLASPIESNVCTPPPVDRGRPPLALTVGHNGILVASGQAPPVVTLRDSQGRMLEVPHLIRGTARKQQYMKLQEETETDDEDGASKTKTVISDAVDLQIKVLLHTGQVINLNENREAPIEKPPQAVPVLPSSSGNLNGHGGIAI